MTLRLFTTVLIAMMPLGSYAETQTASQRARMTYAQAQAAAKNVAAKVTATGRAIVDGKNAAVAKVQAVTAGPRQAVRSGVAKVQAVVAKVEAGAARVQTAVEKVTGPFNVVKSTLKEPVDPKAIGTQDLHYWIDANCNVGINTKSTVGWIRGTLKSTTNNTVINELSLQVGKGFVGTTADNAITGKPEVVSPRTIAIKDGAQKRMLDDAGISVDDDVVIRYDIFAHPLVSKNMVAEMARRWTGGYIIDKDAVTNSAVTSVQKVETDSTQDYFAKHPYALARKPLNITGNEYVTPGYIVEAKHTGKCLKTYEVMVQINGKEAQLMSIQKPELFDYAVQVLNSGRRVKINYTTVDSVGQAGTSTKSGNIIWSLEVTDNEAVKAAAQARLAAANAAQAPAAAAN